ncbi:Putative vacuolar segregation subunit 7 [Septoria linicola]|uniref:Vacuolar segregation subunit 7 n=1 Tax=Septoria linicola TaxID=215465 RepID=A0A9Q9AW99_9PEZI|nr:Putative vacuolar segregation subunit 7 [Septoria linicola]
MASKDSGQGAFRSISGQAETAEPSNGGTNGNGSGPSTGSASRKTSSTQLRQPTQSSSSGSSVPTLRKSSSTNLTPIVASPAPGASPRSSRNASPIRQDKPAAVPSALSTQPSAAAIQRALSASSVPQLQSKGSTVSEAVAKLPGRAQKSAAASGETTPQWPMSPRLKSPPPSGPNSRRGSAAAQQRKPDPSAMPSIQVLSATPQNNAPATTSARAASVDNQRPDVQLQAPPPPKASARGASGKSTLETVQENSSDAQEPSPAAVQAAADLKPLTKIAGEEPKRSPTKSETEKLSQPGESGSESAGNKSDSNKRGRRQSTGTSSQTTQSQPPAAKKANTQQKSSHSIGPTAKERQAAGKQNMTVETETVQSIPQSQLAPANDRSGLRNESGGTVKLKPSNETIRPKKERKKAVPKTRSVNQGTATSKADLFEARVASAVDEANTSDSDETFVYESNPPEQPRRHRHHSRTPSVTSSHSMADQQRGVIRGYNDPFDGPRVGGKRSMKFSTNPTNPYGMDSPDSSNGTVRMHTPKHIGRFGRTANQSASHDQDSPFTQASKLRNNHLAQGRSRPTSPRSPQNMQFRPSSFFSNTRKQEQSFAFDADGGQTADDERTPLMGHGTVRTPRRSQYHPHRFSNSVTHSMDNYYDHEEPRGWLGMKRWGGCLLTTLVLILVVVTAVGFVFASNRPLYDVKVHKIHNVLASETELMLDLLVGAVNPNTMGISVSELDVNIFAKSKHVTMPNATDPDAPTTRNMRYGSRASGSGDKDKNPNLIQDPDGHWHNPGDKEPEADPENDAQTLLLGRVFHFDQALSFEASPLKQHEHVSSGQLRLTKPGNGTESRGSAKWEEIIQYPFELIVRGTIKYQLPISSRPQSVAIGAKTVVHPEEDLDSHGNMKTAPVDHSEHWQWIDLPEEEDSIDEQTVADAIAARIAEVE